MCVEARVWRLVWGSMCVVFVDVCVEVCVCVGVRICVWRCVHMEVCACGGMQSGLDGGLRAAFTASRAAPGSMGALVGKEKLS